MQCPQCGSTHIRKNGIKQGKQNHMRVSIAVVNSLPFMPPLGHIQTTLSNTNVEFQIIFRFLRLNFASFYCPNALVQNYPLSGYRWRNIA